MVTTLVALVELGICSRERFRPVAHSIQIIPMPAFPARDLPFAPPVPSTVLKWGCDGELSDLDRRSIVQRLQVVDPFASQLRLTMRDGIAASSVIPASDISAARNMCTASNVSAGDNVTTG